MFLRFGRTLFVMAAVPVYLYLKLGGGLSLLSGGIEQVEQQPAQQIASRMRAKFRMGSYLFRYSGIRIVDQDVYYHNHAIVAYFKVKTKKPLMPSNAELYEYMQDKLHSMAAGTFCSYLRAAEGARRMEISIVKEDMTESVSVRLYKNECLSRA